MPPLRVKHLFVVFFIIAVLINVNVSFVRGRYVVEVRFFGYNNPTQRCHRCRIGGPSGNPGCCDDHTTGTCLSNHLRCDSYFLYCLRTLNSPVERIESCSYSGRRRSNPNANDGALNFSQSVVLGLENPLQLQGLTNTYNGVQLYTEIQDSDTSTADDFVDFITVDHDLAVNQTSLRRNYTGFYGFVTMDLTITVLCAQNFQGADCTECTPGFTGPNCDEADNCFQVTCSGNGRCVDGTNSFTCSCDTGFTGESCQTDINDCVKVNCSGNGQCVDGTNSFTCSCNPGFTGDHCQTNINNCVGVDCSGNGRCVDGLDSFSCACDPGFTGDICQIDIDDCVKATCSGNGRCVDGTNSYTCSCNPGFTGELCQTNFNDCVGVNCSGNGRCVDGTDSFTCSCDPGFTGELCQTDINDCVGVNCSGNGRCVDGTDSFNCDCDPGFTGDICHITVTMKQEPTTPYTTTEPAGVPSSDSRISAGALGGSIAAGTLILLIPVLILTVVCVYKMLIHREQWQSSKSNEEQLHSEADNQFQISLSNLKANEAYGTTLDCDVENEDDVLYDEIKINDQEATPHTITDDGNVDHGDEATPHITTEDDEVAYGNEATPHITMEDNVAYNQATPHITTEDNVAYSQATPHILTEENVVCDQINEDSSVSNSNDFEDSGY